MAITTYEKTIEYPKLSPVAERMRRHRERLRAGVRCYQIELRETEVDELISRRLLDPVSRVITMLL